MLKDCVHTCIFGSKIKRFLYLYGNHKNIRKILNDISYLKHFLDHNTILRMQNKFIYAQDEI